MQHIPLENLETGKENILEDNEETNNMDETSFFKLVPFIQSPLFFFLY